MNSTDEQSRDFLIATGLSFGEALSSQPGYTEGSPHDYQEVLWNALGEHFGPLDLKAALASDGAARIAAECARYFEAAPPALTAIESALHQCLFRWSASDSG